MTISLKHVICSGLALGCLLTARAQGPQLSANLQQYLHNPQQQAQHTVLYKRSNTTYAGALIKVETGFKANTLTNMGILVGTRAGNIWTVQVPLQKLEALTRLSGITYVQLDEPVSANLDAARKASRVDSVHNAINLPMAYTGKNVVVGIIDAGFDFGHPTFFDTSGQVLRVKRVWEQHNTGTPPAGYQYGNELTDSAAMLNKGYEVNSFSHGTHVGGIAAGSGYGGATSKYRGVAYESDLVFVGIRPEKSEWKTMGMSSIVDAVNYIFNYAKSVGKPAVVNLSWGCSIGPNDGTSLFSQAIDQLTGPGRIFVLSAGNNGDENIHVSKSFTVADTALNSFVSFPTINGEKRTWIDVWGENGQSFCVQLALYNGASRVSETKQFCLNNQTNDTFLVGSAGDTCFLTITATAADFNGKPHVLVDAFSKSSNQLCLSVKATSGLVHAWLGYVNDYNGYYGAFITNGQSWATSGNSRFTLGEMSSTRSAITVAAYVSKISFKNLANATQSYSGYAITSAIAPFSSIGPTADLRRKPDIAAPGMTIASAVNSYDVSYASGGSNYASSVANFTSPRNNRTYYYAEASGTSMSSPMMSGIVALMLQVNPELYPQRIKDILSRTVIRDNFTMPNPDSTRWGMGKVNAYAAVKEALLSTGLNNAAPLTKQDVELYPNPSNGGQFSLFLSLGNAQPVYVSICNVLGQQLYETRLDGLAGYNQFEIVPQNLSNGLYYVSLKTASGLVSKTLLVNP